MCRKFESRKDVDHAAHRNINVLKENLWHVCAVEHLKKDAVFDFIQCMLQDMSRGPPKEVALKCSKDVGVFSGTISSCAAGPEGE